MFVVCTNSAVAGLCGTINLSVGLGSTPNDFDLFRGLYGGPVWLIRYNLSVDLGSTPINYLTSCLGDGDLFEHLRNNICP